MEAMFLFFLSQPSARIWIGKFHGTFLLRETIHQRSSRSNPYMLVVTPQRTVRFFQGSAVGLEEWQQALIAGRTGYNQFGSLFQAEVTGGKTE
jgi:hypothetical protein